MKSLDDLPKREQIDYNNYADSIADEQELIRAIRQSAPSPETMAVIRKVEKQFKGVDEALSALERDHCVPLVCPGGCGDQRCIRTDEGIVCKSCKETYLEE